MTIRAGALIHDAVCILDLFAATEFIHHIADGDYLCKEFLLRAAGDPEREFSLEWYWCLPQDEWVKRWSYAGRDLAPSFALLKANRQHTEEMLGQVPWLWDKSLLIPHDTPIDEGWRGKAATALYEGRAPETTAP